ncbi:hypothetical protein FQN60_005959 [Etheostoma spectabile]|uniref:Uncharacterized protein n=1 Tax=Etheostoma spectabile TaxID=54343 RepID=A0A5J5CEQ4_9PERO|nr:hypothetical protein FQN60_005959 [Etheostoma spectabile]
MKELMERTTSLEQQVGHIEERLGDTEDKMARLERMAAFLLYQEAKLTAKCDDLESQHNTDIRIERAHRSLIDKPKVSGAPPRAIIVSFLDACMKEQVIQQAWKEKTTYEGQGCTYDFFTRWSFEQGWSDPGRKPETRIRGRLTELGRGGAVDENLKSGGATPKVQSRALSTTERPQWRAEKLNPLYLSETEYCKLCQASPMPSERVFSTAAIVGKTKDLKLNVPNKVRTELDESQTNVKRVVAAVDLFFLIFCVVLLCHRDGLHLTADRKLKKDWLS